MERPFRVAFPPFGCWHVLPAWRVSNAARGGETLVSTLLKGLTESAGDIDFEAGRETERKGLGGRRRLFMVERT